jgi:hypothetical protein
MPTRTTPRSTPAAGRRPRTQPPAGRFPRASTPRPSTRRTNLSSGVLSRRKPAPRSKSDKALSGLVGLLPGGVLGKAAKPSAGGGKGKKAGFALLAGAAGLALKNRDKLPGGRKTEEPVAPATPASTEYVATAPATGNSVPTTPTTPPAV